MNIVKWWRLYRDDRVQSWDFLRKSHVPI